eukprot:gene11822-13046_t
MSSLPSAGFVNVDNKGEESRKLSRQRSLTFVTPCAVQVQRKVSTAPAKSNDADAANTPQPAKKPPSVFGTRKKKIVLFSISLYWFTVNCAYAMIAPFFPGEAANKGSNTTVTGLIFAVFPLVMFVFSPVVGIMLPLVGPKFTLMCGLFVEGGSQILFGFLDLMPDGHIFIIFCFLVRVVSGLGATATSTASLTLLVQHFHENISPAMGVMETFGGFGMMAGAPIGGFLYALGGFKLPFLVLGSLIVISLFPVYWVLPSDDEDDTEEGANKGALLQALKIPAVFIVAMLTAVGGMALSFLEPTLQGHLQKPFHLNSTKIGLMFLIAPGIYAILAPLIGMVADKKDKRVIMVVGGVIMAISYILLGPTPFLPKNIIPSTLWLNGVALAVLGIGVGPFLVPGLSDMNDSAVRYGMAGDLSTHSAISGIFNAMFSIGAIAGPTVGGILVESTNFSWAAAIFGFFLLLWAVILGVFTLCERRILKKKALSDESKPLLAHA